MQIDEIITRLHALSRTEDGYILTDDDKKLLAIVSSQLSEVALTLMDEEESR